MATYGDLVAQMAPRLRALRQALPPDQTFAMDEGRIEQAVVDAVRLVLDQVDLEPFLTFDAVLCTTTNAQRAYAFPDDFHRFLLGYRDQAESGVLITDGTTETPLWADQIATFSVQRTSTADRPRRFIVTSDGLTLDPPPNSTTYTVHATYVKRVDLATFDFNAIVPLAEPALLEELALARYLQSGVPEALAALVTTEQRHRLETQWADRPQRYQGTVAAYAARTYRDLLTLAMPDLRQRLAQTWQPGQPLPRVNEGYLERCLVEVLLQLSDMIDLDMFTMFDQSIATTSSGTRSYAFPATFGRLLTFKRPDQTGIRLSDGTTEWDLLYQPILDLTQTKTSTNDRPGLFTLTTSGFTLDPPPDSNSGSNYTLRGTYIRKIDYATFDLAQAVAFPAPQALQDAAVGRYLGIPIDGALERCVTQELRHKQRFQWQYASSGPRQRWHTGGRR